MRSLFGAIVNYKLKKEIMPVPIDRVYQKVLALANKEQRGYITPQEFNLFADHAQMEIFEQYFYDLERAIGKTPADTEFADKATNLDEKISLFEMYNTPTPVTNQYGDVRLGHLNIYRLGAVRVKIKGFGPYHKPAEQLDTKELDKYSTPLTNSLNSLAGPYFLKYGSLDELRVKIYPHPSNSNSYDDVRVSYVRRPLVPNWTYFVTNDGAALYNSTGSGHQDFQLHVSEENNLVTKILQLAGVSIKDYQLTAIAAQSDGKTSQQKN